MLRSGIILFLVPTGLVLLHTTELDAFSGPLLQTFCYISYSLSLIFILGTLASHVYLDYKRDRFTPSR